MMQTMGTPLPVTTPVTPGTLRARLEETRAAGTRCSLREAVGIVVPISLEVAALHAQGHRLYLHPSAVRADESGRWHLDPVLARRPPSLPRDRACLAPEERAGQPGGSRSSVFAVGAMLYEIVTGETVGPGMRRPSEIVPTVPPALETVLSKALVADPVHRPDDLGALAQAIHHLAPSGSIPPPDADESHLDQDGKFEVDVSMSMMPPPPSTPNVELPSSPYDMDVQQAPESSKPDAAGELQALKARLEADKRARYVVIKDGMDHGPFAAVELLQQIASHTFEEEDVLQDSFSTDSRAIKDWQEFAPFAEHARLHREHKAEKAAIEQVVVEEKKSTRSKALFISAGLGVVLAVGTAWFLTARGAKTDDIAVQGEQSTNIETDGGLKVNKKRGRGGRGRGGVIGNSGGHPILAGGMSCEAAQAAYVEEYNIGGGKKVAPDLTAGQYGSVLNRGSYFAHCGVPENVSVYICAAVQNGRAVGVSVSTKPNRPGINSCVSRAVRGLGFPSHPRLDVTRTTFAAVR